MTTLRIAPDVDYATRDYEGFTQLLVALLDRSESRWTERAAADVGIMLLELLANRLDLLGYAGDRVAEEAFLSTARRRESARRHAMLGDYKLDRGNATHGYQSFSLAAGQALTLPAGTQIAQLLAQGQDVATRLIVETMEDADLDARRNQLALERSAAAGTTVLHLVALDGSALDLEAIGMRPGMALIVIDPDGGGEVVTIARVQAGVAELSDPLGSTYLAGEIGGDGPARVLGNLAPIRRGTTVDWELVGRGGVARGEVQADVFFQRRIDPIRRLRDEAEAAREAWIGDSSHAGWWELANATVAGVVRTLRQSPPAALSDKQQDALDHQLLDAANLFRQLIRASGRAVPDELEPARNVSLPRQEIAISSEQPPLWLKDVQTLEVRVGVAGSFTPWTEVEDFLRCTSDDRSYVVELDGDGQATLLFGDGVNGALLPADSQVMVRRVTGDLFGGDIGAGAITHYLGDLLHDDTTPTTNPLPTSGARPPEPLDDLALRLRRALESPVIPVTVDDYKTMLEARPDIAEVKVTGGKRVDVVFRPRPGYDAARALADTRVFLRDARLAGTDVWVRLAEPLYVSIAVVIEVHPEMTEADVRSRLRTALLAAFAEGDDPILGRARTRAEVYAAVEVVPGVVWSQVIRFDLASRSGERVEESIAPEPYQSVLCRDLAHSPLDGTITIWAARRYRLQIVLAYPDPNTRPDTTWLTNLITALLSGPDATPVREGWTEITAARVDELLQQVPTAGASWRLSTRAIMIGDRVEARVPLLEGEVPILDSLQIRDRRLTPHYGLELELAYDDNTIPDVETLRPAIEGLLSGVTSVPVTDTPPWTEITVRRVNTLLQTKYPPATLGYQLSARMLTLEGRAVDRVPLLPLDVPILVALHIAVRRRQP